MGCRLILNLCQVYYTRSEAAVRPQSIWGVSDGIRFKPPVPCSVSVATENWTMEREPHAPSSTTRTESPGDAYEMVVLDGAKDLGSNDITTVGHGGIEK